MTAEYFNKMAMAWDAKHTETDAEKLRKMAARLEIASGSSVLDAGCGTGVFVPHLTEKIGDKGRLTCLDAACEMLNLARGKGFGGNIEYVCADIENTKLPDETFDAAVCYSSFPHFHDKPAALKEIARLLRPGGRLFIGHSSSRSHINERHARMPQMANDTIPDEAGMRELLSTAGFSDIVIEDGTDSYLAGARKQS
jgi:ubiquinone/menaquinone biosynthesis C-methylase UbiE